MRPIRVVVLSAVLLVGMLAMMALASPVAAFDTFDMGRWPNFGQYFRIQESNGGAALLGLATNGATSQTNELQFANENSVNTIEANVTILEYRAPGGIPANLVRAGLEGFFYWDGSGTGQTGHVRAIIGVGADGAGNPTFFYYVFKCNDSGCGGTTSHFGPVLAGPVNRFQTYRLKLQYDETNFIFQIDGNAPVVFPALDGNRQAPTVPFKRLRTRLDLGGINTVAAVTALFENVSANGAPYDDFNAKTLPRVQMLPGSGTFSSKQTFDAVIMVETGEQVTNLKLTANGADISHVLPQAIQGNLPSGGLTRRFVGVPASILGADGPPVLIGVEATTASGTKASGFALWRTVTANE